MVYRFGFTALLAAPIVALACLIRPLWRRAPEIPVFETRKATFYTAWGEEVSFTICERDSDSEVEVIEACVKAMVL
jgi:hypothetical protein